MAKLRLFWAHFAVELLLLTILIAALGTNLILRTNSGFRAEAKNRSLFFILVKNRPHLNPKLVEAYETVNVKLTNQTLFLPASRQVLAATTLEKNGNPTDQKTVLPTLAGTALLKPNPASSNSPLLPKKDTEVYQVRGGDTVARIASSFGVSIETILWENNLTAAGLIRPGQELNILPVSGVKHLVKEGETVSGIAKKYGLTDDEDLETILEYNGIEIEEHVFPGEEIIIPGGIKKTPPTPKRRQYLADLQKEDYQKIEVPADYQPPSGGGGLLWPLPSAHRLSQRFWSRHRGIDIPCRDCSIIAAAEGIVELSGWQRSYGYTIVINHGAGLKTRYAHGGKLLVSAGQSVASGQAIMISGSTGRSSGPHLHFEVKKNGQLVNPLNLVSR